MARNLFCEISPLTYAISVEKQCAARNIRDFFSSITFASIQNPDPLPFSIYKHSSLIRRFLGNVDMVLQENKAFNLSLAAPCVNGILIKPGETFSYWKLVGKCTTQKGYKEGLTIKHNAPTSGVGGGMCQFTNLLHWMILHSSLDILEHHHHNKFDLFPDYGRQIPFGCGTSIFFNYQDYRFKNNTDEIFQLLVSLTDTHLCGELRSTAPVKTSYHVVEKDSQFVKTSEGYFRQNKIYLEAFDKRTGNKIKSDLLLENNSKVMYDARFINGPIVDQ